MPYAVIKVSEDELQLLRTAVGRAQEQAARAFDAAPDDQRKSFYREVLRRYEVIVEKLDAPLVADTSTDPEADDENEDGET